MSASANFEKIRRRLKVSLILVFLGALWLPALDSLFHWDSTPPANENRRFAQFPEFTGLTHLKQFLAGLEAFFNDHFGFRKKLVTWNNEWKHELFHEAPFSSVMTGRDGWLFLASYQMIEHYTGLARWTQEDLEDWQKLLQAKRDWLAGRGIKYLFVVPPDKHSVYPEYLPEWLQKSKLPSKLDQFVEHMKAHSDVAVLDLRPPLLEAKRQALVYSLTDTHWNPFGAFIGSEAIITALSRQLPELKPLPLDAFERQPLPDRQGDLAGLAGQTKPETNHFVFVPRAPLVPLKQSTRKSHPGKRWPESHSEVTENPDGHGKALVFRDSFANNLVPILGFHFHETIYLWRHDWDIDFIKREKPAVVIDEVLERNCNLYKPKDMLRVLREQMENPDSAPRAPATPTDDKL